MPNNHNLFPLPYWAPALWRVPIPLQLLNEAYARGSGKVGLSQWLNCIALFEWVAHRAARKECSSCAPVASDTSVSRS